MKRVLSALLCTLLVLTMIPVASAKTSFRDVPRNHWAYEAIVEMAERGIIKGYEDGTFRPNRHISRAEFAKIMIAAAGIDITSVNKVKQTFEDVNRNHWAFYYIELAKPYLTGYKIGSTYLYKPDEKALREDIAVALVRLKGYDKTTDPDLDAIERFRDEEKISKNLRPYIAIAVETGLIKGFEDRTFRPLDPITRAEAASLIYRAKLSESKVVFPDEPTKPQEPEMPKSVRDSFSRSDLDNWNTKKASGTWRVINERVTAYSTDDDIQHYFLPLKWEEKSKPSKYELQVDVIPHHSGGYGGLYFNGDDGQVLAVSVEEDRLLVEQVDGAEDDDPKRIASIDYDLKGTNQLRIVVNRDSYEIYVNGTFMFRKRNQSLDNTELGLYLKKEASEKLPRAITYLDNFSFRVLN